MVECKVEKTQNFKLQDKECSLWFQDVYNKMENRSKYAECNDLCRRLLLWAKLVVIHVARGMMKTLHRIIDNLIGIQIKEPVLSVPSHYNNHK
jgi:hypothetical protein